MVNQHGDTPHVVASYLLNARCNASAGPDGKDLFLRGERFLYKIAEAE